MTTYYQGSPNFQDFNCHTDNQISNHWTCIWVDILLAQTIFSLSRVSGQVLLMNTDYKHSDSMMIKFSSESDYNSSRSMCISFETKNHVLRFLHSLYPFFLLSVSFSHLYLSISLALSFSLPVCLSVSLSIATCFVCCYKSFKKEFFLKTFFFLWFI